MCDCGENLKVGTIVVQARVYIIKVIASEMNRNRNQRVAMTAKKHWTNNGL